MNAPQLRGITGLLNGILSVETRDSKAVAKPNKATHTKWTPHAASNDAPKPATAVRRGRPPGKSAARIRKEKVTVWIPASLISVYRDWSWEARSQLSHLIERALADYSRRHRDRHVDAG